MTKIIKFNSIGIAMPNIKPSKSYIPQWYKNLKSYNNKNIFFEENGFVSKTVKSCMPFFDSLSTGYIAELWTDVYCSESENEPHVSYKWQAGPPPIFLRSSKENEIPVPAGHYSDSFTWISPFLLQLPKGYSAIITHPFNRYDLPFTTLTGIIDVENIFNTGKIPFFAKKGFTGVIESGTPIFQIIPFKRESWKLQKEEYLLKLSEENELSGNRKFFGYYKNNWWHKKDFN
jgi:hypothetical protein